MYTYNTFVGSMVLRDSASSSAHETCQTIDKHCLTRLSQAPDVFLHKIWKYVPDNLNAAGCQTCLANIVVDIIS